MAIGLFAFGVVGCNDPKKETTVEVIGLSDFADAWKSSKLVELQPQSMQLGDKSVLYVPKYSSSDGNYSVVYQFYELVDRKLVRIELEN